MSKSAWLRCTVTGGMFSDERAVTVQRSNGTTESYFVPAKDVDDGRVRVAVRDAGEIIWATLPTPDHVTIPVSPGNIVTV